MSALGARRCKSCGALILWALTESGKAMPLDFAPTSDGTIAIAREQHEGQTIWRARVVRLDERNTMRRKSHFASCPNANEHRRKP